MAGKSALMNLGAEEAKLFYKLDWGLMHYANQTYGIMKNVDKPDFHGRDPKEISRLKEKIFSEPGIIDSFASENPLGFGEDELAIVKSWKNFAKGEFYVISHGRGGSVLLAQGEPSKAYLVVGITQPIADLTPFTPALVKTTLLPFKGKIVYHGILNTCNIMFGGGIRRSLGEEYARAKAEYGLIASFDAPPGKSPGSDTSLIRFYVQNLGQESGIACGNDKTYR